MTKVGGDVAALKLHTLDDDEVVVHGLGLLEGDDTLAANLGHGVGDHVANLHVAAGGDGRDVGELLVGNLLGEPLEDIDELGDGGLHAAGELHGVGTGHDDLHALGDHRRGEHGGGGGAVTREVVGLLRRLADEARADVLDGILEVNLLGDGDTVVDDLGGAVLGLEDDVAAFGSEGDTDDVREFVDTFLHLLERGAILGVEVELLGRLGGGGHAGAASGEGGGGCVGLRGRGGFVSRARSDGAGRELAWKMIIDASASRNAETSIRPNGARMAGATRATAAMSDASTSRIASRRCAYAAGVV